MGYYNGWAPYVSVAERRRIAEKKVQDARIKGKPMNPIVLVGKVIAKTFWGKAWCDNLENYSDYENRLPRGRTYVRNGSVIDLQVTRGSVQAQVMGSSLYKVSVQVTPMPLHKWKSLIDTCSGKIASLIELLQGKFSKAVMSILIAKEAELFPSPKEISMSCSCPDHAGMCKHIAAVLYGIGAAIDTQPEWLFLLRQVDQFELIAASATTQALMTSQPSSTAIAESDLSQLFGIELEGDAVPAHGQTSPLATDTTAAAKVKAAKKPKTSSTLKRSAGKASVTKKTKKSRPT